MYSIELISLYYCPYSMAAEELLEKYKPTIIHVNQNDKDKYKNNNVRTFPQVYFKVDNRKLLIGGYSDISTIIKKIQTSDSENVNDLISILKHLKWERKDKTRLLVFLLQK